MVRERLAGYHAALAAADIAATDVVHIECDNQSGHSAKMTTELLSDHSDINGILAMSDVIAIGAIDAARAIGRSVPGDLKVIGIDGIAAGERTDPPLTTMYQDSVEKGGLPPKWRCRMRRAKPSRLKPACCCVAQVR